MSPPQKALLLIVALLLPGCFAGDEPAKGLDPLGDEDGDGLPNGWEQEHGLNPEDDSDAPACQGEVALCLRTYDDVTFPETHNSFATSEDGVLYLATNHWTGLQAQWDGGVRSFLLDAHHLSESSNGPDDVAFCHGDSDGDINPCDYSYVDPFVWLGHLNSLMEGNTSEVVTILFESYVPADHISHLFNQTGLSTKVYTHVIGEDWPSLGEMVIKGTNLVVYWDMAEVEQHPWLHHAWTHTWDTDYADDYAEDMDCELLRGDGEQPVWHLNNWLAGPLGLSDPIRAQQVNDYDFLLNRTIECWEYHDDRPTFVTVDWWEDGELVNVTRTINLMDNWDSEIPPHP